jgi:hypothetical protein
MDLNLRTETWQNDDQSWLASRHGINNGRAITLKTTDFTSSASTYCPDGYLKSGIKLQKNVDGTYSPWATTKVLAGILLTSVQLPANGTSNVVGSMLSHCRVVEAKLVGATLDSGGKASNPLIELV